MVALSQNGLFPFVSRQALHFSISNKLNIAIIGKTIFHFEGKPTAVYFVMKLFIFFVTDSYMYSSGSLEFE